MNHSSSSEDIARELTRDITPLATGTRLPSHRALVTRFGASASTVSRALALLAQRGLVVSRPGAGTFRAAQEPAASSGDTTWQEAALALNPGLADGNPGARRLHSPGLSNTLATPSPGVIDLNSGYAHHSLLPMTALRAALTRAARSPHAWERPPAGGLADLRMWFAEDIGAGLGREDVLVVGGGQAALSTAMRAVAQPGDPVLLEAPTYPGTLAAARAAGLRTVSLPVDAHGMRPDYLDDALGRTGARLVVLQPLYQNPTGVSLTEGRARELLTVARSHDAFVLEDDYARHMTHDDGIPPAKPLILLESDGTVIHIRSLTKVTSPNLRIGALAARGPVLERLRTVHMIDTMVVPAPLQHTALEVLTSSARKRSVARLQTALTQRRRLAVRTVVETLGADVLPDHPRRGYHLWLHLPRGTGESEFVSAALARGTALAPGTYFHADQPDVPRVRLSYAAAPTTADLVTGIHRLEGLV
ncbi:PLP-dependent aminotransferase family protein [Kocuria marina]|uniref:aminotransferase-like domain-containing protein n=1 Tax=Kocuria marina TaxID=223184 RepID=UPI0022E8F444|nr:PLP-dependent aminotransferase family protein [Kocuria marina]